MNLSAHWNRIAFFAASGLVAGAFAIGCTVSTSNIDDPDGGSGTNTSGGDSGSTTDKDAATTTDQDAATTTDSGPGAVCAENKQPADFVIVSAECQACAEEKCCSQLVGCFNLDPGPNGISDGGKNPTCSEYAKYYEEDCIPDCAAADGGADAGGALEECEKACRIGNPAIADAWEAVRNCAQDNCAAACSGE